MAQHLFFYISLFLCISLSVEALPPPSPAGGRMLQLDEQHDFVGTVRAWYSNEQFEELTAEAWIYFEEPPEPGTYWSIIGQEGRFGLVVHGDTNSLGSWVYAIDADVSVDSGAKGLPEKKWLHVVAMYNASAGMGVNGVGGNMCCPGGHMFTSDKHLRIGGIIPLNPARSGFAGENLKFRGYIDEVRISNIIRYEGPKWIVPRRKFTVDEHTISLWHFDEAPWSGQFKDVSGNGYDLWRSGSLAVEARGKLTTVWGDLKH